MSCTLIWRDSVGVDFQLANDPLALAAREEKWPPRRGFSANSNEQKLNQCSPGLAPPSVTEHLGLVLEWSRALTVKLSAFFHTNWQLLWLLTTDDTQRWHVIPTASYYRLTSLLTNGNQLIHNHNFTFLKALWMNYFLKTIRLHKNVINNAFKRLISEIFPWQLSVCPSFSLPCVSFSEYIQKYATEEALKEQEEGGGDSSSESSMSDFSEDEAQDMEL